MLSLFGFEVDFCEKETQKNLVKIAMVTIALFVFGLFSLSGCGAGGGGGTGGGSNPPSNPPSITNVSPATVKAGDTITMTGENFGATRSPSTVSVNGALVGTFISWSNTQIKVAIPNIAPAGANAPVVVSTSAGSSNAYDITVNPYISSLTPNTGNGGDEVTVTGTSFGNSQGTSGITFSGVPANIINWSNSAIRAQVPNGISSGNVVVTIAGIISNGVAFTIGVPHIDSLSPTSGQIGITVSVLGEKFGSVQGSSTVTLNGTACSATSWSNTLVVTSVPIGATSGNVVITTADGTSNGISFTVTGPLNYTFSWRQTGLAVPLKICYNTISSNIYLANRDNVAVFNQSGTRLADLACPDTPIPSVASDNNGNIYTLGGNPTCKVNRYNGSWQTLVSNTQYRALDLDVNDNYIVVLETSDGVDGWVQVFDTNGVLVYGPWQIAGANTPGGIGIGSNNTIAIADTDNHRVLLYTIQGSLTGAYGTNGNANGQFHLPEDVAVSHQDNKIYVMDSGNYRVQVFGQNMSFLGKYQGSQGSGDGQFWSCYGISPDNNGNFFTSDVHSPDHIDNNIQKFVLNP